MKILNEEMILELERWENVTVQGPVFTVENFLNGGGVHVVTLTDNNGNEIFIDADDLWDLLSNL